MNELKISFFNVCHGDSIFIRTPLDQDILIDCGSGDIIPSSILIKIKKLDELQISHPHIDHFDDIINISNKNITSFLCRNLDKFNDSVIGWKGSDVNKIKQLRNLKNKISYNSTVIKKSNDFNYKAWYIDDNNIDYNDPNSASFVTIIQYYSTKILLGGDLPKNYWEILLKNNNFINDIKGTTIIKASHHGRNNACCEKLFEYISPKLTIISDKSKDESNENTVATDWYSKRSSGCNVDGEDTQRKVLTTRSDGSIFINITSENLSVYKNTTWK